MNPILIVFRKELKETLRDRRVRTNAVIAPAFVMLLFLSLIGFMSGLGNKENQIIHVVKTDNQMVRNLKKDKVQIVEVADRAEGERLIRSGKARLVLEFEPDFDAKVKAGQSTTVQGLYDPQQDTSKMALGVTQEELAKENAKTAEDILRNAHVDPKTLSPASLAETKIQVGTSSTSEILIGFLPYLIVLYAFVGGMSAGSDSVAGEKEKQTLETLLIAPVGRSQIAFGKFLAIATVCFLSAFSALMGLVFAGASHLPMYSKIFTNGLGLDAGQLGTMLLVLLPTIAFFASLLLAISAFAKNTRESQSHLGLVSLLVLMPALFGNVIGFTDLASNWWIRLVPVLNTSVTLREALQGKTNPGGVLLTIAVGIVLALIGIRVAVFLFKREEVLTRV